MKNTYWNNLPTYSNRFMPGVRKEISIYSRNTAKKRKKKVYQYRIDANSNIICLYSSFIYLAFRLGLICDPQTLSNRNYVGGNIWSLTHSQKSLLTRIHDPLFINLLLLLRSPSSPYSQLNFEEILM